MFSGSDANNGSKTQEMIENSEINDNCAKSKTVPNIADIENKFSRTLGWIHSPQTKFSIEATGGIITAVVLSIVLACIMLRDLSF